MNSSPGDLTLYALAALAYLGLWLILPQGYVSLLAQMLLAHPPLSARPHEIITAVRTRERK